MKRSKKVQLIVEGQSRLVNQDPADDTPEDVVDFEAASIAIEESLR